MNDNHPIFTVGHSTLSLTEFVDLLEREGVRRVVDVRAYPASRRYPHFGKETLARALRERGISYLHLPELGGRRSKQQGVPPELNAAWRNQSFKNYADYALGPEFASGLGRLRELCALERCAIMCSEGVWWRCHRRIIADHLLAAGERVLHIMTSGVTEATLTPEAVLSEGGGVTYPGGAAAP